MSSPVETAVEKYRSTKNGKYYAEPAIVQYSQQLLDAGQQPKDVAARLMETFGFSFEIRDRILGQLTPPRSQSGNTLQPQQAQRPKQPPPTPAVAVEPETAAAPEVAVQNMDDAIIALNAQMDAEMVITPEKVDQMERWIKVRMSDRAMEAINTAFTATKRRKLNYQDWAIIALLHADSVTNNPGGASPHSRFIEFSASTNEWIKPIFSCHVHRVLASLELMGFTKKITTATRGHATTYSVTEIQ